MILRSSSGSSRRRPEPRSGSRRAIPAPADRPLLDTAVVTPRVARLTSEVVVRALSVLGLGGITQVLAKNPRAVSFPAPITRDGPGWRAAPTRPAVTLRTG